MSDMGGLKVKSFRYADQCLRLCLTEAKLRYEEEKTGELMSPTQINALSRLRNGLSIHNEELSYKLTTAARLMPAVTLRDADLRLFTKHA